MLAERPVRLAIEGGSASGKSTLAALLQDIYACTVFHMDDFFLRPEQRTEARFAEPGGNVDRERFLDEVLAPLLRGERVTYRPFDCSVGALSDPITADASRLTVIEGAYSMHPELAGCYDLSVFLHISPELQRARILVRNSPRMAERFFAEWIPLEHRYFDAFDIEAHCDLSIKIDF
jgi:uridine kinase